MVFLLLYSASDQFYYDWTTLLQYRNYCGSPEFTGPLTRTQATGAYLFSITPKAAPMNTLTQNRGGWPNTNVGASVPASVYYVMMKCRARTASGIINDAYLVLHNIVSGITVQTFEGARAAVGPDGWTDLIVGAQINCSLFVSSTISWSTASDTSPVGAADIEDAMVQIFMTSGQQR